MKIGLVCSQGGHLTQMLQILEAFEGHDFFFITYRCRRVEELDKRYRTYALPYIGASPLRMLKSLPAVWRILWCEKPTTVVSTGAEIAIPVFILAKILRIRTVYVESWSRIRSSSKSGRILYPLVDDFLVQWPKLVQVYGPKARYVGDVQ